MTIKSAIKEFLLHCEFEKSLSQKTLKAYTIDLTQLESFLLQRECVEISLISKIELRAYIVSMAGLKPKSIKRKIAVTKAMFNYLEFEDCLLINPFRKLRLKIKEDKKLPNVMNIKEITKILQTAYLSKSKFKENGNYSFLTSIRDIVVLELLFSTGARVSEISNLPEKCINLDSGSILLKGKGDKERIIHVCNKETILILKSYYKLYREKILKTGYFFINRFDNKLSDQSIRGIVKKYVKMAGINRRITPHVFRHSFATLLLEKDVDIKYIQSLLGHSSIITTQIYTHVNRAKQKHILKTKHPRRHIYMNETTPQ